MLQVQEVPEQAFLRPPEYGHSGAGCCPAEHRDEGGDEKFAEVVARVVGTRIGNVVEGGQEEMHGGEKAPGTLGMTAIKIGYARCSTDRQDLTAQRAALAELGVTEDRIYTDHGLTGTNRDRPGLAQALAAVRAGDVFIVPKLDRLARSVPDARAIAEQLEKKGVKLALGASVYDPTDPMGKMFFNILATFAEFEADLIRMRTREGMAIARAKGKLRGKQPKLSEKQQKELSRMHASGEYSISDLAELFSVSRPTVYRTLQRNSAKTTP